jgi:NADPH2:quinone reductase
MKAIGLFRHLPIDQPEALLDLELPDPEAGERDLLVAVRAVSVNPVDCKVRARDTGVERTARVLGWDASGVVRSVGAEVSLFKPGDEVYYAGSIDRPGANSELHLVDERIVGSKPRSVGFAPAAALPLTTLTAWEGLFDRLGISASGADRGKRLLIIGGAGGVGSIAIQLAKQLAHLEVFATASRPESARWVRELGADAVIDHTRDIAAQLTATPGVDYILCATDFPPYFPLFAQIIRPQGKICLIVSTPKSVDLTPLMQKSATIVWELMFTRAVFKTPDMGRQGVILNEAASLIDRGTLRTTIGQNLGAINAANLRQAHTLLESGRTIGKLVLEGFA